MKKYIIYILAILMILSVFSISFGQLSDIPSDHWAAEAIYNLKNRGIINGYPDGSFGPNKQVQRQHVAKMVAIALDLDLGDGTTLFKDVVDGNEFAKYIAATYEADIFKGKDGLFGWNEDMTRRQIANVIVRAFDLKMGEEEVKFTDLNFSNDPEAIENIKILASNDIVKGYEDGSLYQPGDSTTRAQFAQILFKAMEIAEKAEVEEPEVPAPEPKSKEIKNIKCLGNNKIEIIGSQDLEYEKTILHDPYRIVLDFEDTVLVNEGNFKPKGSHNIVDVRYFNQEGFSRVTFELTGEYAFSNSKDKSIIINIRDTKLKLALDSGHGLFTGGKEVPEYIGIGKMKEWELNDRITREVIRMLDAYADVDVLRLDDPTGQRDVPLRERTDAANAFGADLLISNHHNAGINGRNGGGLVLYRYPNSIKFTKAMQQDLYNKLIAETALKGNRASPLAEANFFMVRECSMAAVLIEHGFMDSHSDMEVIMQPDFATNSARGIVNFLVDQYKLVKK